MANLTPGEFDLETDDGTLHYSVYGEGPVCIAISGGPGLDSRYMGDLGGLSDFLTLVQVHPRGSGLIALAMRTYAEHASDVGPAARDELARLWIEAEVNRLTNIRASQARRQGTPGPEGSVGKLAMALLNQRIMNFSLDVMGADAMLYPGGFPMSRPTTAMDLSNPQKAFLRVQANSIEGGTTFIMKNILGERVLGLPGDIRVDKDRPWSEVPRS